MFKYPITEGILEYKSVGEFLATIKREFGGEEEESVKVVELKKLEQGGRIMEEFVQEFKRTARGSGYERRLLIEKFKKGINEMIRRKLMEAKRPPTSIEQWYKHATNLDRYWRESKKKKRKVEGETRTGSTGSKVTSITASNMAKEARDASTKSSRTCSNGRSRKNKCSSS